MTGQKKKKYVENHVKANLRHALNKLMKGGLKTK